MTHPYDRQPDRAFWRRAIGTRTPEDIGDWYVRRFPLDGKRIATAGSCFAQHIGRRLKEAGFDYVDLEPAPQMLAPGEAGDWGYGLYSARYGNIYTSRQLLQLLQRATGQFTPIEDWWDKDGGVVDPFRPTLEPEPFGSVEELRALRRDHLERVAEVFRTADVLVFTMGLTEAWLSRADGACFPLCPGTAGGTFDAGRHRLSNLGTAEVRADMEAFLTLARSLNPQLEVILTVSPVSMMATATPQQVSVATVYTKSVLRAVAGEIVASHGFVDYFPGYDIVTGPASRGVFYQEGMREVTPEGVTHVMSVFFDQHRPPNSDADAADPTGGLTPRMAPPMADIAGGGGRKGPRAGKAGPGRPPQTVHQPPDEFDEMDVKCDEELLDSFGKPRRS
ncbi:MAG: GSCFA domain-containing protein [Rhodobacter sp.]|nr:GSCFA domain-containing protein [Paracoccaceae bacterium]MCC0075422.1 GSCFA domain-containing protein [Rhodobacter sp.]